MNVAFIAAVIVPSICRGDSTLDDLRMWGLATESNIEASFRISGSPLYAETVSSTGMQSGGENGKAFVWTEATQMRVMDDLAEISPRVYDPILLNFSNQVYTSYWNNGYRVRGESGPVLVSR